jgi:hypothetical protein
VTTWSLYAAFDAAGIKPCGRLTKCEHRRFLRALAERSELERTHLTIALRHSALLPIEIAEAEEREALECLMR